MSASAIEDVELWYHTLELPGGPTTPGWFDLRGVAGKLPWPDVRGKRCLDIGTYDGFYAFELERRGASEVVATDISDHDQWDWPAAARARGPEGLAALAGQKGRGFKVAHAALESSVRKVEVSVYDLDPAEIGTFDVVICGSLMLHLRDPVRALESIRSVCRGEFMSVEEVSRPFSLVLRRRPVADMRFDEELCQWWVVNVAGHRRLLEIAGFEVISLIPPFTLPFGAGYPVAPRRLGVGLGGRGKRGVTHAALLSRPVLDAPSAAS